MLLFIDAEAASRNVPRPRELEVLLAGVAAGDRDSLADLYSRTRTAVYALALSILQQADDAQDVTQDAFVHIWEGVQGYRPRGKPMAWMLTIARNLALARLRERQRLAPLPEEAWDAIPAAPDMPYEDRQLLQEAMKKLDRQERQVVLLHAAAGLKHREIAALLKLPLSTVLSKYRRALRKLRLSLEGR